MEISWGEVALLLELLHSCRSELPGLGVPGEGRAGASSGGDRSSRENLNNFNLRANLYFLNRGWGQLRGRRREEDIGRVGRSS